MDKIMKTIDHLDEFLYFIIAENAIMGVTSSNDKVTHAYVVAAKTNNKIDVLIHLDTSKVMNSVSNGTTTILDNIPDYYSSIIDDLNKNNNK